MVKIVYMMMLAILCAAPFCAMAVGTVLPPAPGAAGKKTIAGIDVDKDGVRDDVQRYIALTYPDSARVRSVFYPYSTAMTTAMQGADDKQLSMKNTAVLDRLSRCLQFSFPIEGVYEMVKLLEAEIVNTEPRLRAWLAHDAQLGGETFRLLPLSKSNCDVDPETLAN